MKVRFLVAMIVFAALAPAGIAAGSATDVFDRMRTLSGTWQGKDEDGQPATLTYEVTSGGTAVMEKLTPGDHPCMITMYHMDGDKMMCTHYCARNNQPRMRLKSYEPASGVIDFDFVDATNLSSPDSGHMHKLTIKNPDKDHLTQEWAWHEGTQDSVATFIFERQKKK